jgi:hypothetical protein
VSELASACRLLGDVWVNLHVANQPVPEPQRVVVLMLRVMDTLGLPEHSWSMLKTAARIASATGPALRTHVRGRCAQLVADGYQVDASIVDLVGDRRGRLS